MLDDRLDPETRKIRSDLSPLSIRVEAAEQMRRIVASALVLENHVGEVTDPVGIVAQTTFHGVGALAAIERGALVIGREPVGSCVTGEGQSRKTCKSLQVFDR